MVLRLTKAAVQQYYVAVYSIILLLLSIKLRPLARVAQRVLSKIELHGFFRVVKRNKQLKKSVVHMATPTHAYVVTRANGSESAKNPP